MMDYSCVGKKLHRLWNSSTKCLIACFVRFILLKLNSYSIHVIYFVSLSFLGFGVLSSMTPRSADSFRPQKLDLFFTSVSASTVSSMSTVEMEVFSNSQLVVLTVLMFVGGEIFTSMVELHLRQSSFNKQWQVEEKVENLELGNINDQSDQTLFHDLEILKYKAMKFLGFVVLGYLVVVNLLGTGLVSLYVALVSSAKNVLNNKGLNSFTFSIFTTISTFASCGFVPTNENMIVFKKNSGLLLILIPQVLLGNTLFPSCLRCCVWFLGQFVNKEESSYLLKNTREIGYLHLLPRIHSLFLVGTVLGFILVQFVTFCSMEWNSNSLNGLSSYEKFVGVLFQTVNTRHTGETIVDLSSISQAILVLFVVMMYLPPYTSFIPVKSKEKDDENSKRKKGTKRGKLAKNIIMSQLSYLAIFIVLICITERQKMKEDPINFSALNITLEVISAYGNVGFTTGYGCARQLNPDPNCKDKWFGFAGKWSDQGKIILMFVMLFGRLKKFNMNGGKAWILL